MALKSTREKLYFDVSIQDDAKKEQRFVLTQFSAGTPGDRYGHLFENYDPLSSNPANNELRSGRAVTALFQPSSCNNPKNLGASIVFISGTNNDVANWTVIGSESPDCGSWTTKKNDPTLRRHFGIQINTEVTGFGVINAQKQHSIEA